jgi:valyl-tRNA synthetase
MGWPDQTTELKKFYPTSALVTGFDILFFWVARMMMMGLHFMDEVPFKDVYIHALVRDAHGQKMSKSKGNVIDPLTVIDQYGTDAFRFTLAAFAAQGRDIKLAEERISGYRNFCNKVWNAARFTLMNLEGFDPDAVRFEDLQISDADEWILHRLNETSKEVGSALEEYRFNEAAMALYQFTWSEFCDWYLELIKQELYGDDQAKRLSAQYILWTVLEHLLRLLHPIMPFITEEIWQVLPKGGKCGARGSGGDWAPSIMLAPYPQHREDWQFEDAAARMEQVMEVISAIRTIRGEMEVPPSREISAIVTTSSRRAEALARAFESKIKGLARLGELTIGIDLEKPEDASVQPAGKYQVYVPLKGLVDVAEEEKRLLKEIGKLEKDIEMFSKKLENPSFVDRAPADIVAKEKAKLAEVTAKKVVLEESLVKIRALR